ncbi:uncharacterized protein LOC133800240 [Humulus lupulus]|uniref:uncharacterized protein LOC133800240 n=1 Tax=Humulus lupulus TaxID=3486 RepID=UPI002B40A324|nr:uncharacterized protein LOC133800240 [Humulus lupulus]
MKQQQEMIKRQEEMMRQFMEQMKGQHSGFGGSSHASVPNYGSPIDQVTPSHQASPKSQDQPLAPPPPQPEEAPVFIPTPGSNQDKMIECKFALGSITNIVGRGYILVTSSSDIHGENLGENYRGAIEFADQPDALLVNPIPDSEIYTVKQAIGSLIRWPKSLVIFNGATQEVVKKKGKQAGKKTSLPLAPQTQKLVPKRAPKESLSQEVQQPSSLSPKLRQVFEIVNAWTKHDYAVEVSIDFDVFGHACEYFALFRDEILEFCRNEMIGQSCIVFYMRILYQTLLLDEEKKGSLLFMNPNKVSTSVTRADSRAQALCDRMLYCTSKKQDWGALDVIFIISPFALLLFSRSSQCTIR